MDEDEYEAELATIESLSESDVLDFLSRHHHDYTTCEFCSEVMYEGGGSIVQELLGRFRDLGIHPTSRVVEEMCRLTLGPLTEAEFEMGNGPPTSELIALTRFPECTLASYEEIVHWFSPRWYNEQGWTIEDVKDFVLERAALPNAPGDFPKKATGAFHGSRHVGPLEACDECQDVIQQANRGL